MHRIEGFVLAGGASRRRRIAKADLFSGGRTLVREEILSLREISRIVRTQPLGISRNISPNVHASRHLWTGAISRILFQVLAFFVFP
jgi:hypothetical protein